MNCEILEPLNKSEALAKQAEIDELLGLISAHELRLAKSYARLGGLLREVKKQQYWMAYGYERFSSYLEFIRGKIGRERSQVYAILQVAEALLPLMSEEQLEAVGITKAHELRRLVAQGGNLDAEFSDPWVRDGLTVQIMDYAADPKVTAKQLRVKVNEILHVHEEPQGLWLDLGGFYATTDEREEIEQFKTVGKALFAPPDEQSEHVVWHDIFMAAARECLGTWSAEAADGR